MVNSSLRKQVWWERAYYGGGQRSEVMRGGGFQVCTAGGHATCMEGGGVQGLAPGQGPRGKGRDREAGTGEGKSRASVKGGS